MCEEKKQTPQIFFPLSPEAILYLKNMQKHSPSVKTRLLANALLIGLSKPDKLPEVPPEKQILS